MKWCKETPGANCKTGKTTSRSELWNNYWSKFRFSHVSTNSRKLCPCHSFEFSASSSLFPGVPLYSSNVYFVSIHFSLVFTLLACQEWCRKSVIDASNCSIWPFARRVGVAISLECCLLLPYFKSIIAIFGSHHLNSALKMRDYRFLIVLWCSHLWTTPIYFYYLSRQSTNPKTHHRDLPSSELYQWTFPQIIQPSCYDL